MPECLFHLLLGLDYDQSSAICPSEWVTIEMLIYYKEHININLSFEVENYSTSSDQRIQQCCDVMYISMCLDYMTAYLTLLQSKHCSNTLL